MNYQIKKNRLALFLLVISLSSITSANANRKSKPIGIILQLDIYMANANSNDSLFLSADNIVLTMSGNPRYNFTAINNGKGHFIFQLKGIPPFGYFSLSKNRSKKLVNVTDSPVLMSNELFYEKGDDLTLNLDFTENDTGIGGGAKINFKGRGAEKYNLIKNLSHMRFTDLTIKEQQELELKMLQTFKRKITALSFNIIKANLIYNRKNFGTKRPILKPENQIAMVNYYSNLLKDADDTEVSDLGLANSIGFQKYLLTNKNGILINASYQQFNNYVPEWIFKKIIQMNIRPKSREVLLMNYFYLSRPKAVRFTDQYQNSLIYITDLEYQGLLNEMRMKENRIFSMDFTFEDTNGVKTSLKAFERKLLVIDFWFTGCGGCSQYYQDVLSKTEQHFQGDTNIVFLSISVDRNKLTWVKSVRSGLYTSVHANNLYTSGLGTGHPIIRANGVQAYPYVMIVDQQMKIRYANSSNLYSPNTLIASIQAIANP